MQRQGDIPDRHDVRPTTNISGVRSSSKVELVDEIVSAGGVAHIYCKSINRAPDDSATAEDIHVYDYNSHRFPEHGILYVVNGDIEMWIDGDDIGVIERHYE